MPLLKHVVFDHEFMTHLDFTHISMLFNLLRSEDYQRIVLEYLDDILGNNSPRYGWALESVKLMFLSCPIAHKKIVEFECENIIIALQKAFLDNRHFALFVLKIPQLYSFFKIPSDEAYNIH